MRVGVLGGGQLGRMLALAGLPLGMRFRFFDPGPAEPVQELGELIRADYDDQVALAEFAEGLDVVTFEFENVPDSAAAFLSTRVPVLPSSLALASARDRLAERECLESVGIPVASYRRVDSLADLSEAREALGLPLVVKARSMGYDGKGQRLVRSDADLAAAWEALVERPCIAEQFIAFSRELSSVAVRARNGEIRFYPLVQNVHEEGILVETVAPAPDVHADVARLAETRVQELMERLDYVGVMAVEWFETGDGLLANEIAPRVHNSGHWTQDGADTSQFENHIRAITGLPLGGTNALYPRTVMTNLIGTLPDAAVLFANGGRVHLYNKAPRPGRKLGHVNRTGAPLDS